MLLPFYAPIASDNLIGTHAQAPQRLLDIAGLFCTVDGGAYRSRFVRLIYLNYLIKKIKKI